MSFNLKQSIPNFITLINLFCGCAALIAVVNHAFFTAFVLLFIGGWADFFDGMVARWLEVHSPLGKELDSLADMVSFGVVPGTIVYTLLSIYWDCTGQICWWALVGYSITIFSALRLAKFNIDTRQSDDFIGLATPSNTVFFTGLMLMYDNDTFGVADWIIHPFFLIPVTLFFSYLLVAEVRMFSFKFKKFQWKGNEIQFLFIFLSINLMILLREGSFSIIIVLYLIFVFIKNNFMTKNLKKSK